MRIVTKGNNIVFFRMKKNLFDDSKISTGMLIFTQNSKGYSKESVPVCDYAVPVQVPRPVSLSMVHKAQTKISPVCFNLIKSVSPVEYLRFHVCAVPGFYYKK
jgi:hypothetical protein